MPAPPNDYVPPPWLAWFRRHLWVIAGVLGVVTITALRPRLRHEPAPPPALFSLPEYALIDQAARPFSPTTLRDTVWVAGFVFTTCPTTCPAVTAAMAQLHERFAAAEVPVRLVSFTVDPEHDTPEVLADYAAQVGADGDAWRFVTGDLAGIRALVRDGFRLGIGERQPVDGTGALYDIAHSTKLALVDGDGVVRGFYGIEPEAGLDEIFHRAQHVIAQAQEARSQ